MKRSFSFILVVYKQTFYKVFIVLKTLQSADDSLT